MFGGNIFKHASTFLRHGWTGLDGVVNDISYFSVPKQLIDHGKLAGEIILFPLPLMGRLNLLQDNWP